MNLFDTGLLATAGAVAGGINAIAGGGSLISFPALIAAGYPDLTANVTNTVALWPGYVGGVAGYRSELAGQRRRAITFGATSTAGGVAGCLLLLMTPARVFAVMVPVLIAVASLLLALQPWLKRRVAASERISAGGHRLMLHAGLLVGGVYGAYFGAGLGVLLLGILGIFVSEHLQRLNAVRAVLSLVINTVALVGFGLFGPVHWDVVAVMAVASLAGGFGGARIARRLSPVVLRAVVVTFGFSVAVTLALR